MELGAYFAAPHESGYVKGDINAVIFYSARPRASLPQSSSASRFTAGAFGFLLLIQCGERPER
jgi:hypothetical protein